VFVNGIEQSEGTDFEVIGASVVFGRTFTPVRRLSLWRWGLLILGVWSSYRPHDTIDIVYAKDGRRLVAHLEPPGMVEAR
jgi:hypothetical protein